MDPLTSTGDLEKVDTALDDASGSSILKKAEKRRAAREQSLFLDVPTWDGDLICEYRVPDPDTLRAVAEATVRRARSNGEGAKPAANDVALIVAASVGLYARHPQTGERVAIEDEHGHVGYNRIAKVLGKDDELKSNDDVVRYLMAERNKDGTYTDNIVAISMHANSIQRWMRDPSKRSSGIDIEEILGEL